MLTIEKAQMLNKPYIHYIDVKIMNNVSNHWTDILIRQQGNHWTVLIMICSFKMLI
jgi:hypothetical protein